AMTMAFVLQLSKFLGRLSRIPIAPKLSPSKRCIQFMLHWICKLTWSFDDLRSKYPPSSRYHIDVDTRAVLDRI
ncbi:6763_t:CDS:1, partial [Paraglomus brasilianum]